LLWWKFRYAKEIQDYRQYFLGTVNLLTWNNKQNCKEYVLTTAYK